MRREERRMGSLVKHYAKFCKMYQFFHNAIMIVHFTCHFIVHCHVLRKHLSNNSKHFCFFTFSFICCHVQSQNCEYVILSFQNVLLMLSIVLHITLHCVNVFEGLFIHFYTLLHFELINVFFVALKLHNLWCKLYGLSSMWKNCHFEECMAK